MTDINAVKHRSLLQWFPQLRRHLYRGTSEPSARYNCLAWAVGEAYRRWDPTRDRGGRNHWPNESRSTTLNDAVAAFRIIGFRPVEVPHARAGWQTITLYAVDGEITHAARLLENGRWTSKLGDDIDIEHDTLDALGGGAYGEPVIALERPIAANRGG